MARQPRDDAKGIGGINKTDNTAAADTVAFLNRQRKAHLIIRDTRCIRPTTKDRGITKFKKKLVVILMRSVILGRSHALVAISL